MTLKMTSRKHLFIVALLTISIVIAISSSALAVNANSDPFPFTQPDGTLIAVRLFGDEFLHWEEDANGELIVFDDGQDGYCYGVWTDDGAMSSGELVGAGLSVIALKPPGQRQQIPQSVLNKAAALRDELTAGLDDDGDAAFVQAMSSALAAESGTPPVYASVESLKRDMLMIHVTFEDRSNILTSGGQVMPKMSGKQIYDLCFGLRGEVDRSVNCYYQDLFMTDEIVITPPTVLVPMDGYQGVIEVVMPGQHPHWGSNDAPSFVFMRDAMVKACAENLVDLTQFDKNKDGNLAREELAIGMIIDGFEYSMGNIRPNFWGVSISSTPAANLTQGVKIASLFAQGAFHRNSGNVYSDAGTAGVIVHEMGHSGYSFQDTYDTGSLNASSGGLGYWSMQASGDNGRLAGEYAGMTSGYQCAYNMVRSGIVLPGKAAYGEKVVMDNHLDIYLVQTPIVTPVESTPGINLLAPNYRGQYFLLQQRKWGETFNYDRGAFYYINASSNESTGGMLIQHVDLNVPSNRISNKPGHYRAGYEEAHGGTQHMQGRSGPTERRGDLGDLWGVSKHEFSLNSDPKSGIYAHDDGRVWVNALTPIPHQNTPSGITLTDIVWDPATFSTSFVLQAPTYENLYLSVQGETNAAAAYRAFAEQALDEGYKAIATLFTATADAEEKHAADEWAVLQTLGATERPVAQTPTVGSTLQNLQTALTGETYEYTVMYPAFVAQAQEDGMADAERIFRRAMGAEEVHAGNYADVLTLLNAGETELIKQKYDIVYRCTICGEVVTDLPASRCPICGARPEDFVEYVTPYLFRSWIETSQKSYHIGDTILVDVMLKCDINYTMFAADITFDSDLLRYDTYTYLTGWVASAILDGGKVSVRNMPSFNMVLGAPGPADMKIATLQFTVLDSFSEETVATAIGLPIVMVNPSGGTLILDTAPGRVLPLTLTE